MKTPEKVFANLENGNLTDAKKGANGFSSFRLSMYARHVLGWSFDRATIAAVAAVAAI